MQFQHLFMAATTSDEGQLAAAALDAVCRLLSILHPQVNLVSPHVQPTHIPKHILQGLHCLHRI
jgi:hypothetical protein